MDEFESLSNSKWECKYHIVFVPKCRRKVLYASLRQHLGEVFDDLDSSEVRSVAGGGVYQRQECHPSGSGVRRAEAELSRA